MSSSTEDKRRQPPRALTDIQEQRAIVYLDHKLSSLYRNFETRTTVTTTLPNISSYLDAVTSLLQFIVQIPATQPSNSLRTAYLLTLSSHLPDALSTYQIHEQSLSKLWQTLNLFDKAWSVVLTGQDWDVYVNGPLVVERGHDDNLEQVSTSWTDRARLSSIVTDVRTTLAIALGIPTSGLSTNNESLRQEYNPRGQIVEPRLAPNETKMTNGEHDQIEVEHMQRQDVEQTPSLTTDDVAMSVEDDEVNTPRINNENEEEEEEEEEEFEEVDVASSSATTRTTTTTNDQIDNNVNLVESDHVFDVHYHDPTPVTNESFPNVQPIVTRGFDPDSEYGINDDDETDEDINVRQQANKVFQQTLKTLRMLGTVSQQQDDAVVI
ncbi:hypothetical protein OIO90_000324 [Microbotryomycetes sp. JL221]|nr:hypothetical protein OIO90_000324 [Microbotryomycetes sp. JL221]